MSLLPAAMQDRDPLMKLGAKVTKPEPVKVDPVKAFEEGEHLPDGDVFKASRDSGVKDWLAQVADLLTQQNQLLADLPFTMSVDDVVHEYVPSASLGKRSGIRIVGLNESFPSTSNGPLVYPSFTYNTKRAREECRRVFDCGSTGTGPFPDIDASALAGPAGALDA